MERAEKLTVARSAFLPTFFPFDGRWDAFRGSLRRGAPALIFLWHWSSGQLEFT